MSRLRNGVVGALTGTVVALAMILVSTMFAAFLYALAYATSAPVAFIAFVVGVFAIAGFVVGWRR